MECGFSYNAACSTNSHWDIQANIANLYKHIAQQPQGRKNILAGLYNQINCLLHATWIQVHYIRTYSIILDFRIKPIALDYTLERIL